MAGCSGPLGRSDAAAPEVMVPVATVRVATAARADAMVAAAAGTKFQPPEMDSSERRMYVLGMLKASLGIGMIYVLAFAVIVGALVLIW